MSLTHKEIYVLAWAVREAQSLRGVYERQEDREAFQNSIDEAKLVLTKLRRQLKESQK